jgi:uncharacterized membrane protein
VSDNLYEEITPVPARDRVEAGLQNMVLSGAVVVARHWLAAANLVLIVFVSLPLLAPLLLANGYSQPARAIYSAYRIVCHQEPQRSYFIAGPYATYSSAQLQVLVGEPVSPSFTGSPATGYKMAYCERDTAIYLAILLFGLFLALSGRRLPRLPLRLYLLLLVPIAADGLTQLLGLRESTWLLRTLSGGLFGVATAWLFFPDLDRAIRQWAAGASTTRKA